MALISCFLIARAFFPSSKLASTMLDARRFGIRNELALGHNLKFACLNLYVLLY